MRPTQKDIERIFPSGAYWLPCAGGCHLSAPGYPKPLGHTYYGYTKKETLAHWRRQHPRKNGV